MACAVDQAPPQHYKKRTIMIALSFPPVLHAVAMIALILVISILPTPKKKV
jgi:hypothetical protein